MAQMATQKTQHWKVLGSIPSWGLTIFLVFCWLLWSLWDPLLSICHHAANKPNNSHKKQRRMYPLSLRCVQVPVIIQETGDWGMYKLWLLSSQKSMVHVSMREHTKNEDLFESLTKNLSVCTTKNMCWNKYRPNGSNL